MAVGDENIVVIGEVHEPRGRQLLLVVDALNALRSGLGPGQGGQEERGQDGNDGDNHQQLDESETRTAWI